MPSPEKIDYPGGAAQESKRLYGEYKVAVDNVTETQHPYYAARVAENIVNATDFAHEHADQLYSDAMAEESHVETLEPESLAESLTDLLAAGANPKSLLDAGADASELVASDQLPQPSGFILSNLTQLLEAGVNPDSMVDRLDNESLSSTMFDSIEQFLVAGVTPDKLIAKLKLSDMFNSWMNPKNAQRVLELAGMFGFMDQFVSQLEPEYIANNLTQFLEAGVDPNQLAAQIGSSWVENAELRAKLLAAGADEELIRAKVLEA